MGKTARLLTLAATGVALVLPTPDWEALHVEDDHGPDPSVPEGVERAGTDPLWVGDATGVQASAVTGNGTTVSDAKVILIQPGVLATDTDEPRAAGVIEPEASRAPYRYGGAQLPVLGAHTASYNANSFGVAVIGNFEKAAPPQAMLEMTARVIGWKLDANYRSPLATIVLDGSRLHTVSGHRDTKATACPGNQLYNKLGWLKQRVKTLIGGSRLGAGSARLGLPITESYAVEGGSKQKYQRGWLIYNQRQGKVYVQYGSAS